MDIKDEGESEQVIRAPKSGTISLGMLAKGETVVEGQSLLTIVPDGEQLLLRLLIPPASAGVVHPGARASVALRAYPRERFGRMLATITAVNGSALNPADLPFPTELREPIFVGTAEITELPIGQGGTRLSLRPGMVADAYVETERRRIIEWLFYPIAKRLEQAADRRSNT